jgi:hypothetical protein
MANLFFVLGKKKNYLLDCESLAREHWLDDHSQQDYVQA